MNREQRNRYINCLIIAITLVVFFITTGYAAYQATR